MEIFNEEAINITGIYAVVKYDMNEALGKGRSRHYNPHLSTYELIYFLDGRNRVNYNNVIINDTSGTVRYMPKSKNAGNYDLDILESGSCIDVYFDSNSPLPDFAVSTRPIPALEDLFVRLFNIWSQKNRGYYIRSMRTLYEIIEVLMRQSDASYSSRALLDKFDLAQNYLIRHFSDRVFDFEALCKQTGYSYSYFKAKFKEIYKRTPVEELTACRMRHAKELLMTGKYSVAEIAEQCGYENIYYFSNAFKKYYGVSPKNYNPLSEIIRPG